MGTINRIRELWKGSAEKQALRERVAYLEGRLAERDESQSGSPLDAVTKARIAERTEEILAGRNRPTPAQQKRDMAERIARHEILAEQEHAAARRRSA